MGFMKNLGKQIGKVIQKAPSINEKLGAAMSKPMMMPKSGNLGDMLVRKGRPAPVDMPPADPQAVANGYKKGGSVGSASKRADGIAQRGKTIGKTIDMCGGGMAKGRK